MRSAVTTVGKRGREISPSCFCHSQLILSFPPPLCSSSFLAVHRIWPGPLFSTMMFSRLSDQTLPNRSLPPSNYFFSLWMSLSVCYFLLLVHLTLWSMSSVSWFSEFFFSLNVLWDYRFYFSLSVVTGFVIISKVYLSRPSKNPLSRPYRGLYCPVPPALQECWLFYQHPNVEFWSNSLCVPNIALGFRGDVFMTRTLNAACRKNAHMRNMAWISNTSLRHKDSVLWAWGYVLLLK